MDIDTDSEHGKRPKIIESFKKFYGEDRVLNIISFKTETSKSAIKTAARGLGITNEEAQELADMVPVHRGKAYTINEALYGDGDEKKAVKGFESLIRSYDGLLETALKIEGVVSGVSSHASGLYIFNQPYIEQNSMMRTPNGLPVTCWNMHDSDSAGALKIDILTIENLDIIRTTLDLLLEDGVIEWQGSLKKTYEKYIHPDMLDYTTTEMWDMLSNGKAINIFQLSTDVGQQACNLIKPHSLKETSLVNSLMRLSSDEGELPLQKYKRFHDNIQLWYDEMHEANLNAEEIKTLEEHLLVNSGIAAEQEDVMLLSQDPKIANFTMGEANKLRKGIAKKNPKILQDCKDMFYNKGYENGVRKEMLDYVWEKEISLSLGYSFSRNHTCPYSCIGLQQLNLLFHYSPVYSHTAYLSVISSSNEGNESSAIDYGAIAKTISEIRKTGIDVELPNINTAGVGFKPDTKNNGVLFSLKGMNSINTETANLIIQNRPYSSMQDFIDKTGLTKSNMINLIKAGCFDTIEKDKTRYDLMWEYLIGLAKQSRAYKEKLTGTNFKEIVELNLLPEKYDNCVRLYNFNKYITNKEFEYTKIKNKTWLIAKDKAFSYFEKNYLPDLVEEKDYYYDNMGIIFNKSSYNKLYKDKMSEVLDYINTPDFIKKYNESYYKYKASLEFEKYCQGSQSDWEMDSVSFYHSGHALAKVNYNKYNLSKFSELSTEPIVEKTETRNDRTWNRYYLSRICGTVLDTDRLKHTVTLLTPDDEIVIVKFYAGQFINYNKKIVDIDENGKKITKEESWFKRGRKLAIVGYRRDDQFIPKTYRNSIYRHSVSLIKNIDNNGNLTLEDLRYGEKENNWSRS